MSDTDALRRSLLVKFRGLTQERLVRLNNAFLTLEENPDNPPLVGELLREVHTLKGEAKMMGFAAINAVAHQTEDLLLWARSRAFVLPRDISKLILAGFDLIGALLAQEQNAESQQAAERFTAQAAAALRSDESAPAPQQATSAGTPAPSSSTVRANERGSLYVPRERLDQLTDLTGDLALGQGRTETAVRGVGALLSGLRRELQKMKHLLPRSQDGTLHDHFDLRIDDVDKVARLLTHCNDELFDQRVRLQSLEDGVRQTRLVQLSNLLSRFPRAARDLAGEQGKQVHVHIDGTDVAVDSDVLDQLNEPLLHLVRNCVDHGIEVPSQRLRVGKTEVGTITLTAVQRGTMVHITVGDDGVGIDPRRVLEVAVRRNLLTPQQARGISQDELHALLFRPGFSTRSTVTDVSGRGMGLDIVRQLVLHLGGQVEMQSRPGRGTAFRLAVPVSMVLSRALVMRLGKHCLAVPSEAVHSARLVPPGEMTRFTATRKTLRVDDVLVGVSDMADVLQLPRDAKTSQEGEAVLVLQQRGQLRGFVLDGFMGERQVVQRKLDSFCDGLQLLHGTAVLSDGALALMLNVPELMQATVSAPAPQLPDGARVTGQVLIVDDSEVSRDGLVSFLHSRGWRVREAVNGADALRQAELERPDVIITDLDLPLLDGFDLMRALRDRTALHHVPVVVLTQSTAPGDEAKARALGARTFLRKPALDREDLLMTLQQLAQAPKA